MNHLKRDNPSVWLGMLVDFETKKRSAHPDNATGVNITLTLQFAKAYEEKSGRDVISCIKSKKQLGVKYSNGMLRIAGDRLAEMYSEVIPKIKNHLNKLLRDCNAHSVSKMFVVGGFGESAYIQEFLKSEFGRKVQVLVPEEAGMCVMKGAVAFGHNSEIITSRVARYNYCVCTRRLPKESDDHSRIEVIPDVGERVRSLNRFVRKNQIIKIDEEVTKPLNPMKGNISTFAINLYTTETDTDDPNDPDATKIETIVMSSPDVSKGKNRNIHVCLRFGGTDILFKATDEESGNVAESAVTF